MYVNSTGVKAIWEKKHVVRNVSFTIKLAPLLRFWDQVKCLIFYKPVETEEYLVVRNLAARRNIQNGTGTFEMVSQNMGRRCKACDGIAGDNFENLLRINCKKKK